MRAFEHVFRRDMMLAASMAHAVDCDTSQVKATLLF